jgi:nucleoside-diphosphate-sugar epimerase
MKEKVVITGAGGFIGGHLVSYLLSKGYKDIVAADVKPLESWYQKYENVENVSTDVSIFENCVRITKGANEVYNLAADMGGMGFIENNKALCMLSVLTNTHMMMASKTNGIDKYFFSSSACVYAADKQTESNITALKEEDAYPAMPEDGYGWEKLFSERMCRHFREDFGIKTRVARYHNVYGPFGTYDGGREKAPAAICRKIAEAKINGTNEIEIWGDGEQTRSFMYIDDCLFGTYSIMNSNIEFPINLGSNEMVSINQLVNLVEDIAGVKLKRTYNLGAPKGVRGRNSDNKKIVENLNWQPSISLREGLEKTYAWIFNEIKTGNTLSHVFN